MNINTSNKTSPEPQNQTLSREDGIKLLEQFRKGLTRRNRNSIKLSQASETCRSVTEKLSPYYEAFPDIQEKAEELVGEWQILGLDEMLGGIDIYPESFDALADAVIY